MKIRRRAGAGAVPGARPGPAPTQLPRSKLTELQATQLVEFFTKKIINESHLVWSTLLDGLNVIFTRFQDHIGVNEYSLVFSDLLSNIHAQSLSDRTNLFKILHLIVKKHTCILKKLPKNFFLEKYWRTFFKVLLFKCYKR